MLNVFTKKIRFSVTPAKLFSLFANAEAQSRATGFRVDGDAVTGKDFSEASGKFRGKTIHAEQDRLIIQTWRASNWKKGAEDSIVVFRFLAAASGTDLFITQSGLPDGAISDIKKFWNSRIIKPMKSFIKAEKKAATPPKPRGRPRKTVSIGQAPAQEAKAKGRPEKETAGTKAPKSRGRPAKNAPSAGEPSTTVRKGKTVSAKKERKPVGKIAKEDSEPATPASKRRGRPSAKAAAADRKPELKEKAKKAVAEKTVADKTISMSKREKKK